MAAVVSKLLWKSCDKILSHFIFEKIKKTIGRFMNMLLLLVYQSLGNAFISLEISSQLLIFFSLFSFIHAWTFISLQIKEFQIMGLSINDSVYSCVFFFLTGFHFFHLLLGLLLLILLFWSCSFSFKIISIPFPLKNSSVQDSYGFQNRLKIKELNDKKMTALPCNNSMWRKDQEEPCVRQRENRLLRAVINI